MIFVVNGAFCQKNILYPARMPLPVLGFNAKVPLNQQFPKTIIPGNFYTQQLGFMCRQELKFEAITKIPFKFRLGSVQYCDWMEGKKKSGIIPVN